MDDDLSAVVEQNVLVNGAIVPDGQVVTEREFHPVKDLHVFPAMLEDVPSQHRAETISEPVIQSGWRTVEHHPEPDQRLALRIFHGVEFSFGYNLTVEDNCTIHKYVLLDDRGEIVIREGSSISDYANVYSHAHDLNDGMIVENRKTEIGPRARVTYHATVLSGVKVGEQGIVGSMGVVSKDVSPYHIVGGIPAKPLKVKSIAPEELKKAVEQK